MYVCNIKTIQLTVSEISSENETWTHVRTARHGDDNSDDTPTSTWAGDNYTYTIVIQLYHTVRDNVKASENINQSPRY